MSKHSIILLFLCSWVAGSIAQDIPPEAEQQLENLADLEQSETEDDTYLQQLAYYRKNRLNLNHADANELSDLRILTDLQIQNFITYRRLLGDLISLYELQAIPTWDIITIRKLLPFVTIRSAISVKDDFFNRFGAGDHVLLLRASRVLEKAKGFDRSTTGTKYLGSSPRLFFRYRYNYKNLLQYGVVGDKDAGEQFFKGAQRHGFDFYSFHLFARNIGIIHSLAIGDFTVNMGQGLIQWQSLAFKKSGEVISVKRQSSILRPYNSPGEFNFHRGVGLTIRKGKVESTVFGSLRKLSANYVAGANGDAVFFTSFQTSGYHRTQNEIDDRYSLRQTAFGGNIKYAGSRLQAGLNAVHYRFSLPLQKRDEPYNRFAISGDNWSNASIDYSYTYKNLHFFGEAAIDQKANKAFLSGLLLSADPKVDISIVYRRIAKDYQAINGNAFTENSAPTNENGIYGGITIRPCAAWRVDAYADVYSFPWLKYLVDAPGRGKDFLLQFTYTPNKQLVLYSRFRTESKQGNQPDNVTVTNFLVYKPRQNWRTQISYRLSTSFTLRSRVEMVWYHRKSPAAENGYLVYADGLYKPLLKPFSVIVRLQYFETGGYDSRLYVYENDVLYGYSIPAFFNKGYRYYCIFSYDLSEKLTAWARIAQTLYNGSSTIGSGLDEINGPRKTEVKLQLRYSF